MMRLLGRRTGTGQSVLEYVLVLTAVIAGILVAAVKIKTNVSNSLGGVAGVAGTSTDKSVAGQMKEAVVSNLKF
jgi:hypothetical protein